MKFWKCPQCFSEHESKDDTKFSICKHCLTEMKQQPYNYKRQVEVKGDHERNKSYSD